jgi:mono/diheme cytochrome c family protein
MLNSGYRTLLRSLLAAGCAIAVREAAVAADANQGKAIAERWCSGCHLVTAGQTTATTDKAPPFASLAKTPDFGAGKLALLLLAPHPNMPQLSLSRSEIADLAEFIRTLK